MLSTVYLCVDAYMLHTCYIRVVKSLEKVIMERNTDLTCPFKCERIPKTFLCEKSKYVQFYTECTVYHIAHMQTPFNCHYVHEDTFYNIEDCYFDVFLSSLMCF